MNHVSKNTIGAAFLAATMLTIVAFSPTAHAQTISVTTQNATSVGERTAILNGFVNNPNGRSRVYFKWTGGGFSGEQTTNFSEFNGSTSFRATISGLLPGRMYSFYAVAESLTEGGAPVTGGTLSFTTGQQQFLTQQAPTVETRSATDVTGTSAILNGAVNPQGSSDTVRWFEWGTSQTFGKQTPKANQGTSAGNFSYSISDLTPNTIYYYRAVAQNAYGLITGSTYSFRTGGLNYLPPTTTPPSTSTKPIVITQQPKVVGDRSAVIAGTAFPSATVATRGWFEWGKTNALGSVTAIQNIGNAASINYSQEIPSLSPNTTYYYRAVIENERGKAEGVTLSFTTGSGAYTPPATGGTKPTPGKPTNGKTDNGAAAAGVFQGCFPNSLVGWLMLILIVILIVIAIDHLVDRYKKRKEEKKRRQEMSESEPRVIK